MTQRILRMPQVIDRTGVKRSQIYEWIQNDAFPRGIPLGKRARGWLESEINAWIRARVKERDEQSRPIEDSDEDDGEEEEEDEHETAA